MSAVGIVEPERVNSQAAPSCRFLRA